MEISSKYNPKETEAKTLEKWLKNKAFSAGVNPAKKPFSMVIPPPNITGILHMGHALNNTIQDVLIRYKRMRGFETLWMPGTDHAGIATQNVVEKALAKQGLRKEDIGREEFSKKLWSWKEEYGSTIVEQLKKIGASCDWKRLRFTMDKDYSKAVTKVFVWLWNKKLIYRGYYIINWCPRCQTALADEEAPYQDREGFLYYIKYPVKGTNDFITVATTRPETMLGDTAVAVNPKDKRYKPFWNKTIVLPLIERGIKVVKDAFVDPKFGTGAVKVTPAHDPNDFEMGKRHKLESILIMNPDATMNENAGEFKGMDRFEAREVIVETLKERGLIAKIEPYSNSIGHCYRCNTIIEPYLSRQWFVKMKPLAKPAVKAVENKEINFYPKRWTKVYLNWMEGIRDWCISRQIWWGHRLPVYYCKNCEKDIGSKSQITNPKSQTNSKLQIQNLEHKGVIVAEEPPKKCPVCGSIDIYQDEDVLDTWFSSWLWPFATFGWPAEGIEQKKELNYFYPTNTLVTAPEIIFFWVARMIMAGFEFMGKKPFSDIYIHGTVRDSTGKKMSKSLGNIIDPLEIIDKFGTDALRFSLIFLSAGGGSDTYISDEKFLVGRNFCNKIWNASRFILLKIKENNLTINDFEFNGANEVDEWVLGELDDAVKQVSSCLDKYLLNDAAKKAYDFFWHTFCDWYIEITKDTFTLERAKIAVYVLLNSIKLLHPFMPFITEEVFSLIKSAAALPLEESLVKTAWPREYELSSGKKGVKSVSAILNTIKELRNIKSNLNLGQKKISLNVKLKNNKYRKLWLDNKAWIQRLSLAPSVEFKEELERTLYEDDFWALDLDVEFSDMAKFLSALDKKIGKLEAVLTASNKRLKNEKFLANASGDIIAKEKSKFDELLSHVQSLKGLKDAFGKSK